MIGIHQDIVANMLNTVRERISPDSPTNPTWHLTKFIKTKSGYLGISKSLSSFFLVEIST